MTTVVLALHLLITIALILLILLQKTEGNAAGGGFGGGASLSAMMQPRARANPLTRATAVCAIVFFSTSIGLALLAQDRAPTASVITAPTTSGGAVPRVSESVPTVPSADVPAAPAAPGAAPTVPSVPN